MSPRPGSGEPDAYGLVPREVARSLWWPLAIWALGSALAVLAAGAGLKLGLALALAAGLLFGLAAARRVDGRPTAGQPDATSGP